MEESVNETVQSVVELVSTWGLSVLGAVAVLLVGRWISGMLRKGVRRGLERANTDPSLVGFLSGIVYYLALAVTVIAVLNLFGIATTSLVAVLGAAGLAVGLALQGTLSNFSAGTMLLLFRPFKAGDFVEVAGVKGSVDEIGIFTTTLKTPDNIQIIIPNSNVYGAIISNYSAHPTRRNDLVVGISYDDDIARAMDTIKKVLEADDRVLKEPEAAFFVAELGDSSVNLAVRPWCRAEDYWPLRADLTRRLKEEIEAAGCSIPYPQHDVHMIANGAGATTQ